MLNKAKSQHLPQPKQINNENQSKKNFLAVRNWALKWERFSKTKFELMIQKNHKPVRSLLDQSLKSQLTTRLITSSEKMRQANN
jgi:hypothetical protein